jgi:hypothetical protein
MARTSQVAKIETDIDTEAPAGTREAPTLKVTALELAGENYRWREFVCNLPAEAILQDLNDPGIWKAIQQNPQKSLRALDRVTCIAHDHAWIARDLLVVEATSHAVTLAIRPSDIIRTASRTATWEDERHTIKWAGSGYGIFRKPDDVQLMPQTFSTPDAAKHVMFKEFYSTRKVA